MQDRVKKHFLQQVDDVFKYEAVMCKASKRDDLSDLPRWEYERIKTMALAAIHQSRSDSCRRLGAPFHRSKFEGPLFSSIKVGTEESLSRPPLR